MNKKITIAACLCTVLLIIGGASKAYSGSSSCNSLFNNYIKDLAERGTEHTEKLCEQDKQLKKHQHSINQLYDTQYRINGNLILFEDKRFTTSIGAAYNINREKIDNVGLNFTYRFGESYQDKLNKRLEMLERKVERQQQYGPQHFNCTGER